MALKNIFVVGLDDFHLAQLKTLPNARDYRFHPLFSHRELKQQARFPVDQLLVEGPRRLGAFGDRIDAIVGYWDFPVSTVLPILRQCVGLPGPSLEAVLECEHKYWSRLLQAEVVPEQVPAFCVVDPFAEDPLSSVTMDFPFWLKPVKAVLSHLGFRIDDPDDFQHAIERIRQHIGRYAEPFNQILARAELPPTIQAVDGYHCIAEAIISDGVQCTQEGYALGGDIRIYGTVDSLRCGPRQSSFDRYQYPSKLPRTVLSRMTAISQRVIQHLGYDTAPFNIEYFWNAHDDRIWLLEINARLSKSHAPLFRLVDGQSHFQIMLDLGLGRAPQFIKGQGHCGLAAKIMLRHYDDALVIRAPSRDEVAAVEAAVPDTSVQVAVREGMRLSELRDQDSYSFEIATLFVGADGQEALDAIVAQCLAQLPFEMAPITAH